MSSRLWNPTEYYHRAPDSDAMRVMAAIEAWHAEAASNAGTDVVTLESVNLESHLRHVVSGFGLGTSLSPRDAGNAIGAALARVMASTMSQAVLGGTPRATITSQMMMLFNYALDQELAGQIVIQPQTDGTEL